MAIGINSSYSEGIFTSDKEDMIHDGRFWFKPDLHDEKRKWSLVRLNAYRNGTSLSPEYPNSFNGE